MKKAIKRTSLTSLREAAKTFRETREMLKELKEGLDTQQPELITSLEEAGVNNEVGVIYDENDPNKGAAYVQRNKGSEVWEHDKIITWLRKKPSRWLACSTRQFDVRKWEAEVAAGNVPPAVLKRMKKTTAPAAPFIRFGKITNKSL